MNSIDFWTQNYFAHSRTSGLTDFFFAITAIFDFSVYFILIVVGLAFLIYKVRGDRYSVLFIFSIVSSGLVVFLLKTIFSKARPVEGLIQAFGSSFPSYHATIATVFLILLMYVFGDTFSKFFRIIFNTICILVLFLVAVSRVYLGVHWVSDVVFGIILGATLSYIFISVFQLRNRAL